MNIDLNFNKCANPRLITNNTAIKIDKARMKNPDLLTELHILTSRHLMAPRLAGQV